MVRVIKIKLSMCIYVYHGAIDSDNYIFNKMIYKKSFFYIAKIEMYIIFKHDLRYFLK